MTKRQMISTKHKINSNIPNSNFQTRIVLVIGNWDFDFIWNWGFETGG